ncbi:MAG: glycoside hydrolase family 38 C-terminal domain-containing protein [Chloroflexota bacterium]
MKPVRRIAIIIVSVVILLGVGVAFLTAHPASSPEKTREPLGNFDAETRSRIANAKHVVFLIPFSHWDTDWHQSFDTYSKMADQNILRAIQLAKQDARFRFTFEQVLFVQHFWDTNPASRADLVSLVRNRQLTFAWGGITQPDTSLVAPAIQVRNLQLGQNWIEQNFGSAYLPRTAWQSDAFGNSAALPTFLTQLNIPYLFIGRHQGRCDPDYQQCQPLPPLFYWTSPASSAGRVLVAYMSYPTAWADIYQRTDPDAQLAELRKTINAEFKQTDSKYIFLPVGFDFFDPQANLLTLVDKWNTADQDTALVVADPESAFQYLETQSLPEIASDMNPIWQAFYNTRPAAKIYDKESEYYLTAADKFGLLLDVPTSLAWNLAAINAHYDNISGVSYDLVWNNSQRPRYEQTLSTAKEDLANILARIAGQVSAPMVVFNPSSWSRSGIIEINGNLPDINSLPQPIQYIGSDKIAFRVENAPALGYAGLTVGQSTIPHPATIIQNENQVTLSNGLVSVTLDGDHGGTFSSLMLFNKSASQELLKSFGDDVVYWDDSGDVYGAFFGNERARESKVSAALTILADGPLVARVQAVFTLGGQKVVKTVTLKADDPLVEVALDMSALPETTAIAETPTNLDTNTRTDDLGFGAFEHKIDAKPITPGDRTYRRSIFYPVMYWSDTSSNNAGLTLITHGLQGVSGGVTRGVMLIRQVTKDPEGLTDPGVHHLSYGYLPHIGTADSTQPWLASYEFNQPLIAAWKSARSINIQIPFDNEISPRQFNDETAASALPNIFSLLSAQNAMIIDLYRQGNQFEAVILNYGPTQPAALQVGGQQIALPQSVFSLVPISLQSLSLPSTK